MVAFREYSAQTYREGKLSLLSGRAVNLKGFIDPDLPILPTGKQMVGLAGGRMADGSPTEHERVVEWGRPDVSQKFDPWRGVGGEEASAVTSASRSRWSTQNSCTPQSAPAWPFWIGIWKLL